MLSPRPFTCILNDVISLIGIIVCVHRIFVTSSKSSDQVQSIDRSSDKYIDLKLQIRFPLWPRLRNVFTTIFFTQNIHQQNDHQRSHQADPSQSAFRVPRAYFASAFVCTRLCKTFCRVDCANIMCHLWGTLHILLGKRAAQFVSKPCPGGPHNRRRSPQRVRTCRGDKSDTIFYGLAMQSILHKKRAIRRIAWVFRGMRTTDLFTRRTQIWAKLLAVISHPGAMVFSPNWP